MTVTYSLKALVTTRERTRVLDIFGLMLRQLLSNLRLKALDTRGYTPLGRLLCMGEFGADERKAISRKMKPPLRRRGRPVSCTSRPGCGFESHPNLLTLGSTARIRFRTSPAVTLTTGSGCRSQRGVPRSQCPEFALLDR